ncbi:hypothetical protein [Nocardia arthritidis]|nr:hypothetical protein [Nocardia arthritidis]
MERPEEIDEALAACAGKAELERGIDILLAGLSVTLLRSGRK